MPGGRGNIRPEDNPKPFKPGQSGNPEGHSQKRRQIKQLSEILIEKLGAEDGDKGDIDEIIEKLIAMGKKGDLGAIKEILERAYGKVKQDLSVEGTIVLQFPEQFKNA